MAYSCSNRPSSLIIEGVSWKRITNSATVTQASLSSSCKITAHDRFKTRCVACIFRSRMVKGNSSWPLRGLSTTSSSIFERDRRRSENGMASSCLVRTFISCTFPRDALMAFVSRARWPRFSISALLNIRRGMSEVFCGTIRRWEFAGRSVSLSSHRKTKPTAQLKKWIRSYRSIGLFASRQPLTTQSIFTRSHEPLRLLPSGNLQSSPSDRAVRSVV